MLYWFTYLALNLAQRMAFRGCDRRLAATRSVLIASDALMFYCSRL